MVGVGVAVEEDEATAGLGSSQAMHFLASALFMIEQREHFQPPVGLADVKPNEAHVLAGGATDEVVGIGAAPGLCAVQQTHLAAWGGLVTEQSWHFHDPAGGGGRLKPPRIGAVGTAEGADAMGLAN